MFELISKKGWRMDYREFCRVLGLEQDFYAEEKWQAWKALVAAVNRLGPLLDKLLEEEKVG